MLWQDLFYHLPKVLGGPTVWKLASVIPGYRKDMREDPENYRPVSLISVPGKIRDDYTGYY